MPVVSARTAKDLYDVVVVGSGAAGGQAAYTLTMEGAKVLMLEAGRMYDPVTETPMFTLPNQTPLRDAATPDKQHDFLDATIDGGSVIPGEPYTNAPTDDPQLIYHWWRARMLGGRTNHWGRNCFRYGPYDFKARTYDGMGVDWPIDYEDMAPYYDKVEMLVGVYGHNDGIENLPHSPPGVLHPPPRFRLGEMLAQQRMKRLGIPAISCHRGVMTRLMDHKSLPAKIHPGNPRAQAILAADMQKRAACFWATYCARGCSIRAALQSTTVQIPPAVATGNLDILPHAMAREVALDRNGNASGIIFIDKTTGREERVSGRAVVLAGSAMETVRLMLNSKSDRFPNGVANTSGRLGIAIMDTFSSSVRGHIPLLENYEPHNEDGAAGPHACVQWWGYEDQRKGRLDFTRGYYVSFQSGRGMPSVNAASRIERFTSGSYGDQFKEDARRYYGAFLGFAGQGQMIPDDRTFCEIDPTGVKDKWGIPVLRFHWHYGDNEHRMAAHMRKTFVAIIGEMGGKVVGGEARHPWTFDPNVDSGQPAPMTMNPGGVHECGGAAMGFDAKTSVTNKWGQTWDVKNLFIADGSIHTSNASKNITETIMALSWRTCDHLLDEMRKGNI